MCRQEEDYLLLVHQINRLSFGDQVDRLCSISSTIIEHYSIKVKSRKAFNVFILIFGVDYNSINSFNQIKLLQK